MYLYRKVSSGEDLGPWSKGQFSESLAETEIDFKETRGASLGSSVVLFKYK